MWHKRRLSAALIWAVFMALAIFYWRRRTSTGVKAQQGQKHPHTMPSRKIWQVTGDDRVKPARDCAQPWITSNPGWAHTLHTDTTATAFAARHWGPGGVGVGDPRLARALGELRSAGIRADLARYMLLGAEGGVYTDLDTVPLRRIDEWLPWGEYLGRGARLVVGVEWDERATASGAEGGQQGDGGGGGGGGRPRGVLHEVQFCQWTVVAAGAGHPVFEAMVRRALAQLGEHQSLWGAATLRDVVFSELEVLNMTGPAAWTEVVLAHMRRVDPGGLGAEGLGGFSGLKAPRLVGDVLVLPVDAFGSGMAHSGATREPEVAMVRHLFRGSWREGNKGVPLC